jgi:E3 ubiquitin-protein ligase RNF115/126
LFDGFQSMMPNIFGVAPNDNPEARTIVNWFQNIIGRMATLGQGQQLGDFFLGNEEEMRSLAERLFRMSNQSLGSPPAAKEFVSGLAPVAWKPGATAEDTCLICLDSLEIGTDVFILPCRHGFHPDCLSPWLKMHSECPCCRHKLPAD